MPSSPIKINGMRQPQARICCMLSKDFMPNTTKVANKKPRFAPLAAKLVIKPRFAAGADSAK